MSVKARWFVPDLVSGDEDPFSDDGPTDVTRAGVPVALDEDDVLFRRLGELLEVEQDLYSRGVACAVKDRADTSCHACPFRGRHGRLCSVGTEQEEVLTRMAFIYEERRRGEQ